MRDRGTDKKTARETSLTIEIQRAAYRDRHDQANSWADRPTDRQTDSHIDRSNAVLRLMRGPLTSHDLYKHLRAHTDTDGRTKLQSQTVETSN